MRGVPSSHLGRGSLAAWLGSWPACPVFVPAKPCARPVAGQFRTPSNRNGPETSHFGPWQAMNCGDKCAPVPARASERIIRLCGALKDGFAHANEIVNQGATRACRRTELQGGLPCAPHTPLESPFQSLKQHCWSREKHRYPGENGKGFSR